MIDDLTVNSRSEFKDSNEHYLEQFLLLGAHLENLDKIELKILMALMTVKYVACDSVSQYSEVSFKDIGKFINISAPTLKKYLNILEKKAILNIAHQDELGKGNKNLYMINLKQIRGQNEVF